MKRITHTVEIALDYMSGRDEPAKGIFRNHPVQPEIDERLLIAVRGFNGQGTKGIQPQVHLVGTASALEELGKYLIALARVETADPEPYGSFDNVRDADGGMLRLLPRRVASLP